MKIVSLLFAAALAPALFAAAPTLKPGQYEVVAEMSMTGPPVRMPAQKLLHCYTPQELEDLAATIAGRSATEKCKVLSSKLTGSTLTFATACAYADGSTLTTSGEVTFTSQESYRAVVKLETTGRASHGLDSRRLYDRQHRQADRRVREVRARCEITAGLR